MNVKYDAEFTAKAPPGFNIDGEMKRQVFDSPLIFDKDGRCIQGGKECEVLLHIGSDRFVEIKEKDNTKKLITKHHKAAKMIGELLEEKENNIDSVLKCLEKIGRLIERVRGLEKENGIYQEYIKSLEKKIREDNKIYKEFLIEKFKLQGEIRALERTIDKMIEARK